MSNEEKRAYLEAMVRKTAPGSARRVWAEGQLAQLNGPVAGGKDAKTQGAKGGWR